MGKNIKVSTTKGNNVHQKGRKPHFHFWLCLFLTCHFGYVMSQETEIKRIEERREKQRVDHKQSLAKLVQKPLTVDQQNLLPQLLKNDGKVDQVLSSEAYLTYLRERYGYVYKNFAAYVAAMPTPKRKTAALFMSKSVLSMTDLSELPPTPDTEKLQICVNLYFKVREWLLTDSDIINDTKEFTPFFTTHFINPMMQVYKEALFSIDKKWADSTASGLLKLGQMGRTISLMAKDDTEVFQNAFRECLDKHGSREGLLRCAIAFPDEFALMRSFFEDTAALEKWILNHSPKTKKEAEKSQ